MNNQNLLLQDDPFAAAAPDSLDFLPSHHCAPAPAVERVTLPPCHNCMDTRIEHGVYRNTVCQVCSDESPTTQPLIVAAARDDAAVDRFASAMKAQLAASRLKGRGGWDDPEQCTIEYLNELLHGHIAKGDPVDVGNFAMMIQQRGGSIAAVKRDDVAGDARDAQRYRWLRDVDDSGFDTSLNQTMWDSAVDAAIAASTKEPR